MSDIRIIPIQELLGMKFFIPNYQRGYRWSHQQVVDLLNDIKDFMDTINGASSRIYCIQPLVVKKIYENDLSVLDSIRNSISIEDAKSKIESASVRWDVIDGQQRLTTIYLILTYLDESAKYTISYETRSDSESFLQRIKDKYQSEDKSKNADYFHMANAYTTIMKWFENKDANVDKNRFMQTLLQRVQFIWYETDDPNPIKVFTRLNIGKIGLTDSELIKALFLNSSNFRAMDERHIRLQQMEIASEWDNIEYTLQDDTFWLFIHNTPYDKPTRIDFIFDLIRRKKEFGEIDHLGDDEHITFRYFDGYFKLEQKHIDARWLRKTWCVIQEYFRIFKEWYDDCEMYHYVGFLINQNIEIDTLLDLYHGSISKNQFIDSLKELIRTEIEGCKELVKQYENGASPKTKARPLLLLYNIQTVVEQNSLLKNDDKYKLPIFYKFPFHLFKKESVKKKRCGWEIEHIASNAGDMSDEKNIEIYINCAKNSCPKDIREKIDKWLNGNENKSPTEKREFIDRLLGDTGWSEDNKNKIWNFTLLDAATNQEYQNSVFPFKRMCVASKERGYKLRYNNDQNTKETDPFIETPEVAFVPPCTKNVFAKFYSKFPDHFLSWTIDDAYNYLNNINQVLHKGGFIENQQEDIDKLHSDAKNKKTEIKNE